MILLNGPNTPFGRMALVTALELGLSVENRVIAVAGAEFLDALNPLRQIPTLLLDGDEAVFDSRVICAYFASRAPGQTLLPEDVRVATRWSMIVGLMEAAVARQMERIRPEGEKSPAALAAYERRIARTIARLEAEADTLCTGFDRIDRLSAAVALEYIDFRYPHGWRETAPRLARWLQSVTDRPSMAATRPR
jgi:glutathione S-transferase